MKRRTFAIVMLLISMVMVFNLTSCGGSNTASENTATADEVSATEENDKAEDIGTMQIQRLTYVNFVDDAELPYKIKLYNKATSAYNNPTSIYVNSWYDSEISFSFTNEKNKTVYYIEPGLYIDCNSTNPGVYRSKINNVGEIQTFSMKIYSERITDIAIYKIHFDAGKKEDEVAYMAFRVIRDIRR